MAKINPQITVLQETLSKAVQVTNRSVDGRVVTPILGCILIESGEDCLTLTGTQIEMSIKTKIRAQVNEQGLRIALPAKTLTELITNFPDDSIKMTYDKKTQSVELQSGTTKSKINGVAPDEFPNVDTLDEYDFIIAGNVFKESVRRVIVTTAPATSVHPILTGILLEINDQTMTLMAASGVHMTTRTMSIENSDEKHIKIVIPARSMAEIARLINDDQDVEFSIVRDNLIVFRVGETQLMSQLITGAYPSLAAIFSPSSKVEATVYTSDFIRAVKRIEIFARDTVFRGDLNFNVENRAITISGVSPERGQSDASVEADMTGETLNISIPVNNLLEVLSVIPTEKIVIKISKQGAFIIDPVEELDQKYIGVVMPMSAVKPKVVEKVAPVEEPEREYKEEF